MIDSVSAAPQISWKTVAVERYEKLADASSGKPIRELVTKVTPLVYVAKDGRVTIQEQGTNQTISLLA